MDKTSTNILLCLLLFGDMILVTLLGTWVRDRWAGAQPEEKFSDSGKLVMGAMFALLGLLMAFSFFSAFARFEFRRDLIVQEINAIDTAYLKIDLLAPKHQAQMREHFRRYLDSRLRYQDVMDVDTLKTAMAETHSAQKEIWSLAIPAAETEAARLLFLPAVSVMFDKVTERVTALRSHMPLVIIVVLFLLPLVCAYMVGENLGGSRPFHYAVIFAVVISCLMYVILDIEAPRTGLVRLEHMHEQLQQLGERLRGS